MSRQRLAVTASAAFLALTLAAAPAGVAAAATGSAAAGPYCRSQVAAWAAAQGQSLSADELAQAVAACRLWSAWASLEQASLGAACQQAQSAGAGQPELLQAWFAALCAGSDAGTGGPPGLRLAPPSGSGGSSSCAPAIQSVTPVEVQTDPVVVVQGQCLGSLPAGYSLPYAGDTPYLGLQDTSAFLGAGWEAGYIPESPGWLDGGSACPVEIGAWSGTSITLKLINDGWNAGACPLGAGDSLTVDVSNPETMRSTTAPVQASDPLSILLTAQDGYFIGLDANQVAALAQSVAAATGDPGAQVAVSYAPVDTIDPHEVQVLDDLLSLGTAVPDDVQQLVDGGAAIGLSFATVQQVDAGTAPSPPAIVAAAVNGEFTAISQAVTQLLGKTVPTVNGNTSGNCPGYTPEYIFGEGRGLVLTVSGLSSLPKSLALSGSYDLLGQPAVVGTENSDWSCTPTSSGSDNITGGPANVLSLTDAQGVPISFTVEAATD